MLTPAERLALTSEWNDTGRDPEDDRSEAWTPLVHEMFGAHARRDPRAEAVEKDGRSLTYGELEARSNRMAHALRRLGAGPDVPVALCAPRTIERVIGTVAVLKAGSPYVSLDPDYPEARLRTMLGTARAPILLTERSVRNRMPEGAAIVLCLDDEGWSSSFPAAPPDVRVEPDNLAFVIFTSGSTGEPKGVAIPHRALLNMVRWYENVLGVTPADRGTVTASPAFDPTVTEIWCLLALGGSVTIADEETRLSPSRLLRWWSEQRVTLPDTATPMAELILEQPIPTDLDLRVRYLTTGGDRLHRPPRSGAPFPLVNFYGPAETCVGSTAAFLTGDEPAEERGFPSIGRPLDGTRIYVVDPDFRPVPAGVAGEVCIGGVGVARGYLDRPDLTAERFLPDPWGAQNGVPGARMYRTGDLARRLSDGRLDFLGRADDQVKLRGMRIELGEKIGRASCRERVS
jgi:amino acid adenylation domain-containing protein